MKKSFIILLVFATSIISCNAQLVKTISDVPKLLDKEEVFRGKTLTYLLKEIKPEIKFILGSPESSNGPRLGNIQFFFITKEEYFQQKKMGNKPMFILIKLSNGNKKEYPALSSTIWDKEKEKIYGDMIVQSISIANWR